MSFTTTGFQVPSSSAPNRDAPAVMHFALGKDRRWSLPFASLSHSFASTSSAAFTPPSFDPFREPNSNVDFPAEYCVRSQRNCPYLGGFGVRTKKILGIKNINVYALGVYVDVPAARHSLASFCEVKDPAALAEKPEFYDAIVNAQDFDKTLRVVVTTSLLTREKFLNALNESLGPAMEKAGDVATLEVFRRQFDDVELKKGTEVAFTQLGPKLDLRVDGQEKAVIHSAPLCRSLFSIWLGQEAVSPQARHNMGLGVARLLLDLE